MSFDAVAYLATKGLRGRAASGGREVTYPCFFDCAEPADSRKQKLYVSADEGVYNCKVCGAAGGSYTLQRHFGDDAKEGTTDDAFTRRRILDWAAKTGVEMLRNRDDVMLYLLNERGLDPQTIVERQIGFVGDGWSLTGSLPGEFTREQLAQTGLIWKDGSRAGNDFFYRHLLIPVVARGHVIQIRGRIWGDAKGGKYMSGPGEAVRAFNLDSLDGAEEVILTEGEFDAMRLAEVLAGSSDTRARRIAVVGLPGTNAFPDDLDDRLADIKRIYLGFDSDEPGRIAAEKLRDKYGARARVLQLPHVDGRKCDWTEYLLPAQDGVAWGNAHPYHGHTSTDVMRLMSAAAGKRIHSVAESGAAFREYRALHGGLKTGWDGLDSVISPGLLPGQVVFLLAKTGCLSGDTEICVNRQRKGFRIALRDLYVKFNGLGARSWDTTIPTYVQREVEGVVRLVKLRHAWASGTHTTFTVTTTGGRRIRATRAHPFLTDEGWRRLDELRPGSRLHVNAGRHRFPPQPARPYPRTFAPDHPYASPRSPVGRNGQSVLTHRLVVEARLNGLPFSDFLAQLRRPAAGVEHLTFLDPDVYVVHHVDHDTRNNDLGNLMILTHTEHKQIHAVEAELNVRHLIGYDTVVSVEHYGEEDTYDLEVVDDPHCFLADGFVVANTGKTLLLCNLAYQMRGHRILFISLEMTREEVYHRLERIYLFHNPDANIQHLEEALATIWICDENRLGEKDIAALVTEYAIETGAKPDVVMVDYLGYYARGAKGSSPYEKVTSAAMQLKADAKAGRLVIIAPTQVNRVAKDGKPIDLDDARDSGAIEETGDFVLAAYRPDNALSEDAVNARPTGRLMLSVLKSRHGGVGKVVALQMDTLTLSIVQAGTQDARRAEENSLRAWRGETWEDLRREQTRPRQLQLPHPRTGEQ